MTALASLIYVAIVAGMAAAFGAVAARPSQQTVRTAAFALLGLPMLVLAIVLSAAVT